MIARHPTCSSTHQVKSANCLISASLSDFVVDDALNTASFRAQGGLREVHVRCCAQHYKHKRNERARHPSSNRQMTGDARVTRGQIQRAAFSLRATRLLYKKHPRHPNNWVAERKAPAPAFPVAALYRVSVLARLEESRTQIKILPENSS